MSFSGLLSWGTFGISIISGSSALGFSFISVKQKKNMKIDSVNSIGTIGYPFGEKKKKLPHTLHRNKFQMN